MTTLAAAAHDTDRCLYLDEAIPETPGLRIGRDGEHGYTIMVVDPGQTFPSSVIWLAGPLARLFPLGTIVEPVADP